MEPRPNDTRNEKENKIVVKRGRSFLKTGGGVSKTGPWKMAFRKEMVEKYSYMARKRPSRLGVFTILEQLRTLGRERERRY